MPFFKLTEQSVLFRKREDGLSDSQYNATAVKKILPKGEIVFIQSVEKVTEGMITADKYVLSNGDYLLNVIMLEQPDQKPLLTKADYSDLPEYTLEKVKDPKIYIGIGVVLVGLTLLALMGDD